MKSSLLQALVKFLQDELAIPSESVAIALRRNRDASAAHCIPMILWQYGLVTLDQLDLIFEWLETA
ncbi:DUF2949 domain-containing protein [Spirulina subsalsa FACHB-351]|uniref:DUF2949 domain-containing protein n=1 Tax=Spirulina subsalsa FACHB-351 TaxID=234711 RepID=A0ABT3L4V9_9CYAN|nr:DUF2949 domain-containing protein [Spirulina subsalsa]MCW6036237.1 DUF2949 domain-containing protein [Spirulina subsalsa FACHB-351]